MTRIVFLDRDGVICENRADYVKSWEEFKFLPGAKEALAKLNQAGLRLIIVTNQSAVGRGIMTEETLNKINQRMVAELKKTGVEIEKIYVCPHRPDEDCDCRKPKPGLLKQAAQELDLNLEDCYLVGDSSRDIKAGQRVGCKTILVLTGFTDEEEAAELEGADHVALDLDEAADWIIEDAESRK